MKDTPDNQASQSKRAQAQPQKLTYHLSPSKENRYENI